MEVVLYFRRGAQPKWIKNDNKKPGRCSVFIKGIQDSRDQEPPYLIQEGINALEDFLKDHSLTHFCMEYVTLYWDTEEDLAKLLERQKKLTSIRIIDCEFGNGEEARGGVFIHHLLEQQNSIREYTIENSFYTESIFDLAQCILNNTSLKKFYIKGDGIDQFAMKALLTACGQHSSLNHLSILSNCLFDFRRSNKLSAENRDTLTELVKVLVNNQSIEFLKITSTDPAEVEHFSTDFIQSVQQALKFNIRLNHYELFSISEKHSQQYAWAINSDFDESARKKLEAIIAQTPYPISKFASTSLFFALLIQEIATNDPHLLEINFANASLNNDKIRRLCSALVSNTTITSLNLNHNGLSKKSSQYLGDLLFGNTHLKFIDLSHNNMGDIGVKYIAKSLQSNTSLESLNVSKNMICNEGAHALAQMFQRNSSLKSINLANNSISHGLEPLAWGLKSNFTLTSLSLKNNIMREDDAKYFAVLFKINTSLNNIDFSGNYIRSKGAEDLAKGLKYNQSLTSINLRKNGIQSNGIIALAKNLNANTTIQSLDLEKNATLNKNSLARRFASKLTFFSLSEPKERIHSSPNHSTLLDYWGNDW